MSDESSRVAQWIYETLNADEAITNIIGTDNIWELPAPPDGTYPMVVFHLLSEVDVRTGSGAYRIMVNQLWVIRAVYAAQSYDDAITIADRIDALFDRADGAADGASIFSSVREYGFRQADEDSGYQYRHLGGAFRIYAQR
jgi:hypothetical protein